MLLGPPNFEMLSTAVGMVLLFLCLDKTVICLLSLITVPSLKHDSAELGRVKNVKKVSIRNLFRVFDFHARYHNSDITKLLVEICSLV